MKKLFFTLFLILFLFCISLIFILSTTGIETDKFNNLISQKINQTNKNIQLNLTTVKFKLDVKEVSLFLETTKPNIIYQNFDIPVKNIKVYMNFISLIKSEPKINKINLFFANLDIKQLKNLSIIFKPSNLTSFVNNKIKEGKLDLNLEVYLNERNLLENFIARGSVSNFKTKIISNIDLNEAKFSFFADKSDILIKNFYGKTGPIKIIDGDLQIKISPEISIKSNFNTKLNYNKKFSNYLNFIKDFYSVDNITNLEAYLHNSFLINFDQTYKVVNYNYQSNGKVKNANLNFTKPFHNELIEEKIENLFFRNLEIKTNFSPYKNETTVSGKYASAKENFLPFNLKGIFNKGVTKLKLNADYDKSINIDFLNYQKPKKNIINFSIDLIKNKNELEVERFNLSENNNTIDIYNLKFKKGKFLSLKKFVAKTYLNGKKNNDFSVLFDDKIKIKGTLFDASKLPQILNNKNSKNTITKISKNIEIDFKNVIAPLSENLKNFKLIGEIQKGKFIKISSKGDFGNNNFLDISMQNDNKSKKKYLEIYSDLTRPLLAEYGFFKGLTGGKLLFSSIIENNSSSSKLKIENFKVKNAPGLIKLLSLADLGGLTDLAKGDGLSFDILEISMDENEDFLKINEIIALGPSVSVLMEGYTDESGLTSLRGTLIPAKTLNKMISKIPLLGGVIIPKDVGEGLFGISFKIKGYTGKTKTTINPIRTLTPRFIQKIIDKKKQSK